MGSEGKTGEGRLGRATGCEAGRWDRCSHALFLADGSMVSNSKNLGKKDARRCGIAALQKYSSTNSKCIFHDTDINCNFISLIILCHK